MTWSLSGKVSVAELRQEFEAKRDAAIATQNFSAPDETRCQMDHAITAAEAVVASGAIGHPAMVWVNLVGHANQGNLRKEGWSGDTINVNVSNADPAA